MKRKKTDNYQAILIAGIIVGLFGLLIIIGLIYRPQFLNLGTDVKLSPPMAQTTRDLGVKRIRQIIEGDFAEFKTVSDSEAFCQLNIEGTPEDYSEYWNPFFSQLQEKKNINITGWQFKTHGVPTNPNFKTNIILGIVLQYTPK